MRSGSFSTMGTTPVKKPFWSVVFSEQQPVVPLYTVVTSAVSRYGAL